MQDLVPQPGIEPVPPAVQEQSLYHWTTKEIPRGIFHGVTPQHSEKRCAHQLFGLQTFISAAGWTRGPERCLVYVVYGFAHECGCTKTCDFVCHL